MSKFKNMKIAITHEQPLDEVVVELERLGFSKAMFTPNKNTKSGILVQINNSSLQEYKRKDIEGVLRHIYTTYKTPIMLFAAGTANGHDSIEAYNELIEICKYSILGNNHFFVYIDK